MIATSFTARIVSRETDNYLSCFSWCSLFIYSTRTQLLFKKKPFFVFVFVFLMVFILYVYIFFYFFMPCSFYLLYYCARVLCSI